MTTKRDDDFALAKAAQHPGFTPREDDLEALVALYGAENSAPGAKAYLRTLLRLPEAAGTAALMALPASERPARARLVTLLGQVARQTRSDELIQTLLVLRRDQDLKAAAQAIAALGELESEELEEPLVALWTPALRPELRRVLVRALAKSGGAAALALLKAVPADAADTELERLRQQSLLIIERRLARAEPSTVAADQVLPELEILAYCRRGLEDLVVAELAPLGVARSAGPGVLSLRYRGTLGALFVARCVERFAIKPRQKAALRLGDEAGLCALLSSPEIVSSIAAATSGLVRYRIDWPGLSDPKIWSLARRLTEALPQWVNDPTASTWEIGVSRDGMVELRPKRLVDPRFAYRGHYVFAASHPTVAAALARLGGVVAGDIIWDPFAGSGLELIERARLGPYEKLYGTDIDPNATSAAEANVAAAGVERCELLTMSCLDFKAARPTLILSNPPLGRRVHRGVVEPLLIDFVQHAARLLAPGGRMLFTSPLPDVTARTATAGGLKLKAQRRLDMGGFDVEVQLFTKPGA